MRQVAARTAFAFVLTCAAALSTQAQAVKLTGDEIRALLTGNIVIGRWEGAKYREFFGPDGITIYAREGARSTRGKWRAAGAVDVETKGVKHSDSFDQTTAQVDGTTVNLSLKDKGGLAQALVMLWLQLP